MRTRLELKAADRRARVRGKVSKQEHRIERDLDKPLDAVPVLKIGALRVKTTNRQGTNQRGIGSRTPPRRTR